MLRSPRRHCLADSVLNAAVNDLRFLPMNTSCCDLIMTASFLVSTKAG